MRGYRLFVGLILGLLLLGCGEVRSTVQVVSLSPTEGVQVLLLGERERWEGRTPWEVSLPPGRYFYGASFPGHRQRSGSFVVEASSSPLRVEIPALEPLYGRIRVASNAAVPVYVDGVRAGEAGPDPARPALLGPFPVGERVVSATTVLGEESRTVRVAEGYEAWVEFLWGSRLTVEVSPTDLPSLTVSVDGRPYTSPLDFSPDRLRSRPHAVVEVSAPGYAGWSEEVSLRAGEIVTASAVLYPVPMVTSTVALTETEEARVLAAYRRYWEVWVEAYRTLDGSHLSEVLTGTFLLNQQAGLDLMRELGQEGIVQEPSFSTPTVTILSEVTATLRVVEDVVERPVSG
ncbi:MAG: hypothetical protein ACP5NB_13835, partial [Chloroflexia bacterium]